LSSAGPRKTVLPNGLVLLTVTRENSPIVASLLMYRAGSLYEPAGKTGLAHLTEHMMFRGTRARPQGWIDRLTGQLGGTNNAMTTCDHALYYFVLPSEHWATPLQIEADRMFHCEFSPETFETERRVAVEERMMLDDDPETLVYEAVDTLAFDRHPYQYPVVGLTSDIKGLTQGDLHGFYADRYRPEEAVLAVVGSLEHDRVRAEVEMLFSADCDPREEDARAVVEDPAVTEPRRSVLSGLSPSPQVVLAFRTPAAVHEDTPALELLAALLSSGRSSLMYTRLVDDLGMATEVSASRIPQTDPGLLYLSASLHSGVSPEECEDEILKLVSGLVESGVSENGLSRARNLTRVDLMLGRETCLGQAGAVAFWECLGDWRLGEEHETRLERVTAADIRRVASTYLDPAGRSSAWLVP
jgi:zinc protease